MKKWISILCFTLFMAVNISSAIGGSHPGQTNPSPADDQGSQFGGDSQENSRGPAPNSGDGVSDGSGF